MGHGGSMEKWLTTLIHISITSFQVGLEDEINAYLLQFY
jgi:hypothetical protein